MNRALVPLVALPALLAACAPLAPEPGRPSSPLPLAYEGEAVPDAALQAPLVPWRSFFTDPALQRLIEAALAGNHDARLAALAAEQARVRYGIQGAALWPDISLGARAARSRTPEDLSRMGRAIINSEYRVELGAAAWELDFWGRVRALEEAALQQWLAQREVQRAAEQAIITQAARGWLALCSVEERLAIARDTVASRQQTQHMFRRRVEEGAAARLDLLQVQTLLTQAQALQAQLERERAGTLNALRLLVGGEPPLPAAPQACARLDAIAPPAPGLPSALLDARPDVRAAEHRLHAAGANIAAARAALFPRITLTGALGTASASLDGLFRGASRVWSLAPALDLPIFDAGRRRSQVELSELERDAALVDYCRTVETAFREVADALAAHRWLQAQLDVQQRAEAAHAERARLAALRYEAGAARYLEVLDAQRDWLAARQQTAATRSDLLAARVQLYGALGGGALAENDEKEIGQGLK